MDQPTTSPVFTQVKLTTISTVAVGIPADTFPLKACQGDCDNDDDCKGSLVCYHRDEIETVPGCLGLGISEVDYCSNRPPNYLYFVSQALGPGALGLCEGDCDSDDDCEGTLVCNRRNGYVPVPGCDGKGTRGVDYCRLAGLSGPKPSSNPTLAPSEGPSDPSGPEPTKNQTLPLPISSEGLETVADIPGLEPSEHFRFRARTKNGDAAGPWMESFAFITRCKKDNDERKYFGHLEAWTNTYTNFIMTQPVKVEIEISSNKGDINQIDTAVAHPLASKAVESVTVKNGKAYIIMNSPDQIAVDINGQMDSQHTGRGYDGPPIHTVTVFANPPLSDVPELGRPGVHTVAPGEMPPTGRNDYKTLYFLPGVHDIDRAFPIWSGKTYYIPTDAIVYGTLDSSHGGKNNGHNIRIFGYGTLSGARLAHPDYDIRPLPNPTPILLEGAFNSAVEGVTIEDSAYHSLMMWAGYEPAKPTIVRWVKIFTWRANGDGINPGQNMRIENSFLRTQDDALYVRGVGAKGVKIWNDANGVSFAMWALKEHDRLLVFEDCDILYARKAISGSGGRVFSLRGGGSMGITGGGNVVFRNIRVEDPFPTVQTFFLTTSRDIPELGDDLNSVGQGLTGVTFQNISIAATSVQGNPEILRGHPDAPIR